MEIKVSTLENSDYKSVDSKKSKGKLTFIEKVSRFHLINKYKAYGIGTLSDSQLDKYIDYLNEEKVRYDKNKIDLEIKLEKAKENFEKEAEKIASKNPKKFKKSSFNALNESHKKETKSIDSDINLYNSLIEKNQESLREAIDEKAARSIGPINIAGFDMNFNTENEKEEYTPIEEPKIENNANDLENKIIDETLSKIDSLNSDNIDDVNDQEKNSDITDLNMSFDDIEKNNQGNVDDKKDSETNSMIDETMRSFNQKTNKLKETIKSSSVNVVTSNIERLTGELVNEMTDLIQTVLSESERIAESKFEELKSQISVENEKNQSLTNELNSSKEELNKANDVIVSKDKEIEELKQALASKDKELQERDSRIKEADSGFMELTNEIQRLTNENVNFRTTIKTLLQSASNAIGGYQEPGDTSKVK